MPLWQSPAPLPRSTLHPPPHLALALTMSPLPTKASPSLCLPALDLSAVLLALGGLQVLDCELPESRMLRAPALPQVLPAESLPQMMACSFARA